MAFVSRFWCGHYPAQAGIVPAACGAGGAAYGLAAAGLLLGIVIGSFIGAAAIRLSRGESILVGRSHCDACGQRLRLFELVPVLSYLALRGRCTRCGQKIDIWQPIAETASGLIGAWAFTVSPSAAAGLLFAVFCWTLLLLAILDVTEYWLPDVLTVPLIPLGLAASLLLPAPALGDRVVGAVAGYTSLELLRFLYRCIRKREGMGGGDSKLLGAIGAWVGINSLPFIVIIAAVVAIIVTILKGSRIKYKIHTIKIPLGTYMIIATFLVVVTSARG